MNLKRIRRKQKKCWKGLQLDGSSPIGQVWNKNLKSSGVKIQIRTKQQVLKLQDKIKIVLHWHQHYFGFGMGSSGVDCPVPIRNLIRLVMDKAKISQTNTT